MIWPTRTTSPTTIMVQVPGAPIAAAIEPRPRKIEVDRLDKMTEMKVDLHQKLIERINLAALETMLAFGKFDYLGWKARPGYLHPKVLGSAATPAQRALLQRFDARRNH